MPTKLEKHVLITGEFQELALRSRSSRKPVGLRNDTQGSEDWLINRVISHRYHREADRSRRLDIIICDLGDKLDISIRDAFG